jgi:hypothetical protein
VLFLKQVLRVASPNTGDYDSGAFGNGERHDDVGRGARRPARPLHTLRVERHRHECPILDHSVFHERRGQPSIHREVGSQARRPREQPVEGGNVLRHVGVALVLPAPEPLVDFLEFKAAVLGDGLDLGLAPFVVEAARLRAEPLPSRWRAGGNSRLLCRKLHEGREQAHRLITCSTTGRIQAMQRHWGAAGGAQMGPVSSGSKSSS